MALGTQIRRLRRPRPGTPFVPGNQVRVLVDGAEYFPALLEALGSATRYVFMEVYILVADRTGWRVGEALAARAAAGVEVALGYDAYGSLGLDDAYADMLRAAGVRLLEFRPVSLLRGDWPWSKRNHRKLVVVDGRVGLVGGMNVSDDYAAPADGGRGWRDMAVRIEGPAVAQLEHAFRRSWLRHGGSQLRSEPQSTAAIQGGHLARFVGSYARRDRAEIRRDYLRTIVGATRTVRVVSAYFSPDPVLLRALIRAAKRGVLVEIITAGATDVKLALQVARGLYGPMLRAGISIYEWHERVLHAKTAVVDGQWCTIGSANLNHRSWLIDLEMNATILGGEIGRIMDDQFIADRARSRRIDRALWRSRPLAQRALEWFFGLFRRLV